jgi:hypothetical protein
MLILCFSEGIDSAEKESPHGKHLWSSAPSECVRFSAVARKSVDDDLEKEQRHSQARTLHGEEDLFEKNMMVLEGNWGRQ